MASRRDVLPGGREVDVFISGRGFHRRDHRLSPECERDTAAAKRFLQKALSSPGHPRPRVINVDRNPSYPKGISALRQTGDLGRRCRCRPVRYLNNIIEQDHRAIKRRLRACQGFRSFHAAWRTLQGIDAMNIIRKGQVRWIAKDDIAGQAMFINDILGLTAR